MLLKFRYNRDLIELLKEQLPRYARKWNPSQRGWDISDEYIYEAVRILSDFEPKLARELLTSPRYRRARDKADFSRQKIEASQATDADIAVPSPEGLDYLPYQRAGIQYALNQRGTMIADEMGLGKTIQALGIINATNPDRALVICPASLKLNWLKESLKWLVDDREMVVLYPGTPIPKGRVLAVINFDILKRMEETLLQSWDIVIIDECHYIKNYRVTKGGKPVGAQRAVTSFKILGKADRKILLTGTPIVNKPKEIYPLISALAPESFNNFFAFAKRYCGAIYNGYGWDFDGASNLDELQALLRTTCMVRRLKSEVLKDLPAKRRQLVLLDSASYSSILNREEALNEALEEAVKAIEGGSKDKSLEDDVKALSPSLWLSFEELAKARHATALAKVPEVIQFVENLLEEKDKVVVFAHHKDVVSKIMEAFGNTAVKVVGGMKDIDKDSSVYRFQNDPEVKVFVGNIKAAGVGLTLTAADTVVFAELDWVPGNLSQAEDRCHRIGQVNSVSIFHIVVDGSIDARLAKTVVAKQDVIDKALNNIEVKEVPRVEDIKDLPEKPKMAPVSEEHRITTHLRLRYLASMCDGAQADDGVGFNSFDTNTGRSLAWVEKLTDRQVHLADKILYKYRAQFRDEPFIAYRKDELK